MHGTCAVEDLGNAELEDCLHDKLVAAHPDYNIAVRGDPYAMFDTKLPKIEIFLAKADSPETVLCDSIAKEALRRLTADEVCRELRRRVDALVERARETTPPLAMSAHA